jgi:hypothetical protein
MIVGAAGLFIALMLSRRGSVRLRVDLDLKSGPEDGSGSKPPPQLQKGDDSREASKHDDNEHSNKKPAFRDAWQHWLTATKDLYVAGPRDALLFYSFVLGGLFETGFLLHDMFEWLSGFALTGAHTRAWYFTVILVGIAATAILGKVKELRHVLFGAAGRSRSLLGSVFKRLGR